MNIQHLRLWSVVFGGMTILVAAVAVTLAGATVQRPLPDPARVSVGQQAATLHNVIGGLPAAARIVKLKKGRPIAVKVWAGTTSSKPIR